MSGAHPGGHPRGALWVPQVPLQPPRGTEISICPGPVRKLCLYSASAVGWPVGRAHVRAHRRACKRATKPSAWPYNAAHHTLLAQLGACAGPAQVCLARLTRRVVGCTGAKYKLESPEQCFGSAHVRKSQSKPAAGIQYWCVPVRRCLNEASYEANSNSYFFCLFLQPWLSPGGMCRKLACSWLDCKHKEAFIPVRLGWYSGHGCLLAACCIMVRRKLARLVRPIPDQWPVQFSGITMASPAKSALCKPQGGRG